MSLPNVPVPKLTKNNWKVYSQSIRELLMRQRGTNSIPLSYVIRNTTGNYDAAYASTEEQLIACIQLSGGSYRSDNGSVWSLLSEHAIGSEAESIVNRFEATRNGRAAWMALIAHMESTSYMDNIKSSAMAKIAAAHYNGEKKNFGIVKFYQLHSEAHNDLELAGEPLTDGMKITHFLQGLKDDTAMNFAIASKAEAGVNTFEDFYNSFSAKLSTKLTLTQSTSGNSQRQISQLNSQQGGRGRGRGFSRGSRDFDRNNGRGQRGGGGRGSRGRGRGFRYNPYGNQRWQPRVSEYSSEEWGSLSDDQKQRVRDLRNYIKNSQGQQGAGNNQQRQIQQMNRDDGASLPSQIQLPPPPSTTPPPNPPNSTSVPASSGRAGDAFSTGGSRLGPP